jgi:hypothetical protein
MEIRVQVLVHPRVFDPIGAGSILHLWVEPTPDPHRNRFGCGFHYAPAGGLEIHKTAKT